jgi:hypothetical protein
LAEDREVLIARLQADKTALRRELGTAYTTYHSKRPTNSRGKTYHHHHRLINVTIIIIIILIITIIIYLGDEVALHRDLSAKLEKDAGGYKQLLAEQTTATAVANTRTAEEVAAHKQLVEEMVMLKKELSELPKLQALREEEAVRHEALLTRSEQDVATLNEQYGEITTLKKDLAAVEQVTPQRHQCNTTVTPL